MERKGNTEMIMSLIVLILGFVLLIKGADFFVSGSSDVAKKFNIPSIVIGLTIVSLGTSLPELAVSLTASIHGNNSLAVSNVIGSNMMNLLVVLGASALLNPVKVTKKVLKSDYPLSIAISGVLFVLGILSLSDVESDFNDGHLNIICGSFYMLAELVELFGINPDSL